MELMVPLKELTNAKEAEGRRYHLHFIKNHHLPVGGIKRCRLKSWAGKMLEEHATLQYSFWRIPRQED